jgi:hypothetical protein
MHGFPLIFTLRRKAMGRIDIRLAYALAQQAFIKDGINRVILATDGDFNVGTVDFEMLKQLVRTDVRRVCTGSTECRLLLYRFYYRWS